MGKCSHCGGKLRRIHRTLRERFQHLAVYECADCKSQSVVPRPYHFHLGPFSRCPRCGTYRLSRLRERDRIDRMHWGLFSLLNRLIGGKLMHCAFCRVQFYDRRMLAPEGPVSRMPEIGAIRNSPAQLD